MHLNLNLGEEATYEESLTLSNNKGSEDIGRLQILVDIMFVVFFLGGGALEGIIKR